jgi:hypothetical protein
VSKHAHGSNGSLARAETAPASAAARQTVDRLRQLLAKADGLRNGQQDKRAAKATLDAAGEKVGLPTSTVHDIAREHDLPRRRRSLPKRVHARVDRLIARGETDRVIVRLAEVSKGTVYNRRQTWRKRMGLPRVVKPYLCSGCRCRVVHLPCTICAAKVQRPPAAPVVPTGNLGTYLTAASVT